MSCTLEDQMYQRHVAILPQELLCENSRAALCFFVESRAYCNFFICKKEWPISMGIA